MLAKMERCQSTRGRKASATQESLRYRKLPVQAIRLYMQSAGDKKNTQPLYRVPVLLVTIDTPEASHLPGNESYEFLFKSSGTQKMTLIYPPPLGGSSSTGTPSSTTTSGLPCGQLEVVNRMNPHYRDEQRVNVWRQPDATSEWCYYLGSYRIGVNTLPIKEVQEVKRIFDVPCSIVPMSSIWIQTGRGTWEEKWELWKYEKIDQSTGWINFQNMERCRLDCDPELVSTIAAYAQLAAA